MKELSTLSGLILAPLLLFGLPLVWSNTNANTKTFIWKVWERFLPEREFVLGNYYRLRDSLAFLSSVVFCICWIVFSYHLADIAGLAIVAVFQETPWYVTAVLCMSLVMRWFADRWDKEWDEKQLAKALEIAKRDRES